MQAQAKHVWDKAWDKLMPRKPCWLVADKGHWTTLCAHCTSVEVDASASDGKILKPADHSLRLCIHFLNQNCYGGCSYQMCGCGTWWMNSSTSSSPLRSTGPAAREVGRGSRPPAQGLRPADSGTSRKSSRTCRPLADKSGIVQDLTTPSESRWLCPQRVNTHLLPPPRPPPPPPPPPLLPCPGGRFHVFCSAVDVSAGFMESCV